MCKTKDETCPGTCIKWHLMVAELSTANCGEENIPYLGHYRNAVQRPIETFKRSHQLVDTTPIDQKMAIN